MQPKAQSDHSYEALFRRPDVVAGFDLPKDAPKGTPAKRIRTSFDIDAFASSDSYAGFKSFLAEWCRAAQLIPISAVIDNTSVPRHPTVTTFMSLINDIGSLARATPLEHTQRFGNPAYRTFHKRLEEEAGTYMRTIAGCRTVDDSPMDELCEELKGYFLDSFGNATRIDYGTGHELHFALLLFIVERVGGFKPLEGVLSKQDVARQVVFFIFWGYIKLMRQLQAYFTMEPAGTHGVWGLDDYHHIPFIVGAAQLSGPDEGVVDEGKETSVYTPVRRETIPPPSSINDPVIIAERKADFMYFAMIDWIREKKKGPFHEHSSVLYNVSGLESWRRIMLGMVKMFEGEVLKKINIVQHLLFGAHFTFPDRPNPPSAGEPAKA